VIARDESPVISVTLTPPASEPKPRIISQRILQCPCDDCGRWMILRDYDDGTATLQPYAEPLGDDDIPF
jgi:hypothetical protein